MLILALKVYDEHGWLVFRVEVGHGALSAVARGVLRAAPPLQKLLNILVCLDWQRDVVHGPEFVDECFFGFLDNSVPRAAHKAA